MLHTIQTTCPVFTGFYNTFAGAIIEDQEAAEMDMNPSLTVDNVTFDYEQCRIDIARQFMGQIERRLKRDFHIFCKISFSSLFSPREYNFRNDSINCAFKIHQSSIDRIKAYLHNNMEAWQVFLEDNFKSRSGFDSFYPFGTAWHLENITEVVVFSNALTFMFLNEDENIEAWICDDVSGNVSLDYTITENEVISEDDFVDELNEMGIPEDEKESNGGRIPDSDFYGTWLRFNDCIALNVAYQERIKE